MQTLMTKKVPFKTYDPDSHYLQCFFPNADPKHCHAVENQTGLQICCTNLFVCQEIDMTSVEQILLYTVEMLQEQIWEHNLYKYNGRN